MIIINKIIKSFFVWQQLIRISSVKALKVLLSSVEFQGKGTILSILCPKDVEVTISLFGYAFNCDLSEHIQKCIFLFNYDENAQDFIKKRLKPGDTFLDIGANVGFYSLLAASIVGTTGKVIAIEPNPKTYLKLKNTIETNNIKNILLLNIALGSKNTLLDLFFDPHTSNDTASMVFRAGDTRESIKVRVFALDEIASTHEIQKVHYLKIDVDGFEPDVFAGAKNLLAEGKIETIQAEFCEYWLRENGSSPKMLHNLLIEAGFKDVDGTPRFPRDCIVDRFFIKH